METKDAGNRTHGVVLEACVELEVQELGAKMLLLQQLLL